MGHPSWSLRLNEPLPQPYSRFVPLQLLGSPGGQGTVYLAEDKRQPDNPLCALKFPHVPPEALRDPAERTRFINTFLAEASLGQQLGHPNLAKTRELLDFRLCGDRWPAAAPPVGLAMNFYEPSLAELLVDYPVAEFAEHVVARWLRELAEALAYLHKQGYVHRDLKPENILFETPRGFTGPDSLRHARIILADFGTLARLDQPCRPVCRLPGDLWKSESYYPLWDEREPAPEQTPTPAMDVYALGQLCRVLKDRTTVPCKWLLDAADTCQAATPPQAADLRPRLSPAWDEQLALFRKSGFELERHPGFVGRTAIFQRFEQFAGLNHATGGFFVIQGQPGVGKSALLTNWAARVGQLIGFYFRYNSSTNRAVQMPLAIARQLCQAYGLEFRQPPANDESQYLEEILHKVTQHTERPERLCIFVDALDEAMPDSSTASADSDPNQGPIDAVRYLPRALPEGVFVIVSTRPHARGADHVSLLSGPPTEVVELLDGEKNPEDIEAFFHNQLGERVTPAQVKTLAQDTGWLFLLARQFTEAIHKGLLKVADALALSGSWTGIAEPADRLRACYQGVWDRIRAGEAAPTHKLLEQLTAVLHVAYQWLGEDELSGILSWPDRQANRSPPWDDCDLRRLLHAMTWYLDEQERRSGTFYRIRHKTVREFLQSARGPFTERYVRQKHGTLGTYFCAQAAEQIRGWAAVDPYGRFFAVRHLTQSGDRQHLHLAAELLCDLGYLQATVGDQEETENQEYCPNWR